MTHVSAPAQGPADDLLRQRLEARIRVVPDFPQPGIRFQDITPVLADVQLFVDVVLAMVKPWRGAGVTHVAGIESRGFILASPVALALEAGFIPIRKPGKLPWDRVGQDYALEYGSGRLEMHRDACGNGARVLVVDDVLATGGTAAASCALVESLGASVAGCGFLMTIAGLGGAARIASHRTVSLLNR